MSTRNDSILSRVRRPEYTGENRCMPCTVVNLAIAIGASAIVGIVSPPLAPVVLGVSLGAIYLRGYLVPGTPELTERYLPDRVLRWVDKPPSQTDAALIGAADEGDVIDPEPFLLDAGALEPRPDETDLQLTDEFQTEWREHIEAVRESDYESKLAEILSPDEDIDPDAVDVRIDDRSVTVFRDDTLVAMWPSEAALVADVAVVPLLRERLVEWENTDVGVRGQLLHAVRVFLERCPACGGDLVLSEETMESCCRTAEVATLSCTDCESRLLEVEV